MPETPLQIEVKGLDKIVKAFDKFPKEIQASMEKAGNEASDEILETEGMASPPPETDANAPPYPYYQRGLGTWTSPDHNLRNSEIMPKAWNTVARGYNTKIGNIASYSKWVHDDDLQAQAMGLIGWKKLFATTKSKTREITRIYQNRVDKLIRRLGL
jgi:hypothetical protein